MRSYPDTVGHCKRLDGFGRGSEQTSRHLGFKASHHPPEFHTAAAEFKPLLPPRPVQVLQGVVEDPRLMG